MVKELRGYDFDVLEDARAARFLKLKGAEKFGGGVIWTSVPPTRVLE